MEKHDVRHRLEIWSRRQFVATLGLASGHTILELSAAGATLKKLAPPVVVVSDPQARPFKRLSIASHQVGLSI
jgi:hypothetical protein